MEDFNFLRRVKTRRYLRGGNQNTFSYFAIKKVELKMEKKYAASI